VRPLVSCAEASRLDRDAREGSALPELVLMEDAARGLWTLLRPIALRVRAERQGPLVALCGSGGNAGDALALLRIARFEGAEGLAAILGSERLGEPASVFLGSIRALGLPVLSWEADRAACLELMGRAALLVDGIAGTGLQGPLRGPLAELAAAAVAAGRPLASIDLPSGLRDGSVPGDILLKAAWTLSIEPRKAALYAPARRSACGEILAVEGVFPAGAAAGSACALIEEADLPAWLPPLSPEAHKGSRGRLAAFAGSIGSTGAACIASRAALAAGAGLVSLYASPEILAIISSRLESVMVKPEPAEPGSLDPGRWDALLAGPGWGRGPERRAALAALLSSGLPALLDADAIRLFAELRADGCSARGPLILTPHPGEYEALTGLSPELALADPGPGLKALAAELGAVIVLKSQVTWIAAPDGRLAVWEGMEAGLATAGSGDCLAGLAAGLLASLSAAGVGDAAFSAARAAVVAHGAAGRRLRAERGFFEAGQIAAEAAKLLGGAR